MNLTPGPIRWPFSFEKWYIDTLMPDGSVLLVYLGRMHLLGLTMNRITTELFRPGHKPLRGNAVARRVSGAGSRLRFGSVTLDGDRLAFRTKGLSGELRFVPLRPPEPLGLPFVRDADRRLDWTVEVPDAEVTGHVWWPGGSQSVEGRGYRDRVWLDTPPWRFPISKLTWGRAVAGDQAATWVIARTPGGEVRCHWLNGHRHSEASWPVRLTDSSVLIDNAIYDLDGLRMGLIRPLLRRVAGDPWETKWSARAHIGADAGRAIHEVVRWR